MGWQKQTDFLCTDHNPNMYREPITPAFLQPQNMWRNFTDPLSNYIGVLGYFFLCHIFCILVLYFIRKYFDNLLV